MSTPDTSQAQQPAATNDLRLYLRLLHYAKPYWKVGAISVAAMVALGALEPLLASLMRPLIDESLIQKNPDSLWQVPLLIVVVFTAKGVAEYVANVASQTLAQKVVADLRGLVFAHQIDLPLKRHAMEPGGRMLSRITYDTSAVGEAVSTAWVTIIRDTLILIGLLSFLFYTAWQLTLLVVAMAPVLAFIIRKASGRLRSSNIKVQGLVGRMSGLVEEALLGLKEIKIFQAHDQQTQQFNQTSQGLRKEQMRLVRVQAINVPLVQVLAACSVALVIYVASNMSANNLLTPGEFVAFIAASSMVFEPVRRLTNVNAVLQRGLAGAQSIFSILDEKGESADLGAPSSVPAPGTPGPSVPTVVSPSVSASTPATSTPSASSSTAAPAPGATPAPRLSGHIVFDKVSYSYPNAELAAIENLSLEVHPNEVVAVIGPSGSGKSTLLYLLAGFDQPRSGTIKIDNKPLSSLSLNALRHNIALVSQRVMLFDASIGENIRMGRPSATNDEVIQAAKAAHAWEFIEKLPQQLDTPLGSLGDRLSGGQRQRMAIARAFIKDAPILLLDEATSALDKDSEQAVLQGLSGLIKGRTVILVSHAPERLLKVSRTLNVGC
jgi:subfamily B ATP-binding cassette protein MsbA